MLERLEKYDTFAIPVGTIYYDGDFNCRKSFTIESVGSLAENIERNGLEIPIIVQPMADAGMFEPGRDFRLVAGHRRFVAIVHYLKWLTVPAVIRYGLTKYQAELLNLTENLERADLNPLEEALAIKRLFPGGAKLTTIGDAVKRDSRWVHQRLRLLTLPEPVQIMAASGRLTMLDVEVLVRIEPEKQIEAAERLAKAREKRRPTEKLDVGPELRRSFRNRKSKSQVSAEVKKMVEGGIFGLTPRFGAWVCGYISDAEWETDLAAEIAKIPPTEAALTG